jgi:hypothetical protein
MIWLLSTVKSRRGRTQPRHTLLPWKKECYNRIQIALEGGEGPENHIKLTEYRIQNTEYRIQNTEYRIQNTENRIQNTEYRIQNTEYRIQNTEYRVQIAEYRIQLQQTLCVTNVPVFLYSPWTNDFDGGKSITRAIGGVGPENGFATIEIITSRAT